MSQFRSRGRLDDGMVMDADGALIGVDERDPALVPPGFVSEAVNYLFRNKVAQPRRGIVPLPWVSANRPVWPWDFEPAPEHSFEHPKPIAASVLGGYVFSDANDVEWLIVAVNPTSGATQVWACRQGVKAKQIELPDENYGAGGAAGNPRLTECSFEQCFDRLIWFRGTQFPALELANVRDGFEGVEQAANTEEGEGSFNPEDGTERIPQALTGLFIQNRLVIVHGRDLLTPSDYLNYTRYQVRASMRINQGSADELLCAYKYSESTVIAFKRQSIYAVNNFYNDLSEVRLEELTREYGLAARRAVCGTGRDVFFLSERGISSIVQVLENKARTEDKRWSDAIPRTWGRINWRYAHRATAAYHDGFVYFAVPLDDAEVVNGAGTWTGVNNAILVLDTETGAWAGHWEGRNVLVKDFVKVTYQGRRRLCYVGEDGLVYQLGAVEGPFDDQIRPGSEDPDGEELAAIQPIATRLVTRGYVGGAEGPRGSEAPTVVKRWNGVTVGLSTWAPEFTIRTQVDGANEEETLVSAQGYDRREWHFPFDREAYDVGNPDDDHGDPGRKDYSVDATESGGTYAAYGPILLGSGVNAEQHQEAPVRKRVNQQGRWIQVVIENAAGRCEVKGVRVEGRAGRRRNGAAA